MPVFLSVMWKVIMSENEGRLFGKWLLYCYDVNTHCLYWKVYFDYYNFRLDLDPSSGNYDFHGCTST